LSASAASPRSRRPGRPPSCPGEIAAWVVALRRRGFSLAAISTALNAEGVPTPAGRPQWGKSHVDRLLHTRYVQDIIAETASVGSRASGADDNTGLNQRGLSS